MDVSNITELMDNVYTSFLQNKITKKELEKQLSSTTSAIGNLFERPKKFKVTLVDNIKEPFFGFRIFPNSDEMFVVSKAIACDELSFRKVIALWDHLDSWVLEIDSSVFDRNRINFNPYELTAITLHEIGHSVYSDTVIERMYRAYLNAKIKMDFETKESMKVMHMLYAIPLSVSCAIKDWTDQNSKAEFYADDFVRLFGDRYRESLFNALSKIIKEYGNSYLKSKTERDKAVQTSIEWCNLNAVDLIKRKNKLKDGLVFNTIKTSSLFLKALNILILNKLGVTMRETYTGVATECTVEATCMENMMEKYKFEYVPKQISVYEIPIKYVHTQSALEGFFKKKKQPMSLPSDYDIDVISVEIDRMENQNDRTYVLDLIYNKIEEIEQFMDYTELEPSLKVKYEPKAKEQLKRLSQYRDLVLKKRSFPKNYEVFVKYPHGYEG